MRRAALSLVITTTIALSACGGSKTDDSLVTPKTDAPSTTAGAGTTATTAATSATGATSAASEPTTATSATSGGSAATTIAVDRSNENHLAGVTPRSVDHGPLTITVSDALVSNESPDTFRSTDAPRYDRDQSYAYVQVKMTNRLALTSYYLDTDDVALKPADGEPLKLSDTLGSARNVVDRGATANGWFVFDLQPGQKLDGAALVLGAPGYEQRTLPLTGAVPAPAFPQKVTVGAPGQVRSGDDVFAIEVTSATLDTYIGFDAASGAETSEQARTGRRKLYVQYKASIVSTPNSASAVVPYDLVTLVVNGERQSDDAELDATVTVKMGSSVSNWFVYDVPATGDVALDWGTLADGPVRTKITPA